MKRYTSREADKAFKLWREDQKRRGFRRLPPADVVFRAGYERGILRERAGNLLKFVKGKHRSALSIGFRPLRKK